MAANNPAPVPPPALPPFNGMPRDGLPIGRMVEVLEEMLGQLRQMRELAETDRRNTTELHETQRTISGATKRTEGILDRVSEDMAQVGHKTNQAVEILKQIRDHLLGVDSGR